MSAQRSQRVGSAIFSLTLLLLDDLRAGAQRTVAARIAIPAITLTVAQLLFVTPHLPSRRLVLKRTISCGAIALGAGFSNDRDPNTLGGGFFFVALFVTLIGAAMFVRRWR